MRKPSMRGIWVSALLTPVLAFASGEPAEPPLVPLEEPPLVSPEEPSAAVSPPLPARPSAPAPYGWQIAAGDAAGLATGLTLAITTYGNPGKRPSVAAWLGMGLSGIGTISAPAVHMANRRGQMAMASLATRVFLPPVGSLLGALNLCLLTGGFNRECTEPGMAYGFLLGGAAAATLDFFVFARRPLREAREVEDTHWYGWQTLLVDAGGAAAGVALLINSLAQGKPLGENVPLAFGVGMYLVGIVGSPVIHLVNRQWGAAIGALAMRLLLIPTWLVVGIMGNCAATSGQTGCAERSVPPGFLLGALAVAAFDAWGLAWKAAPAGSGPSGPPAVTWIPAVNVVNRKTTVGVAAVF